MHKYYFTYVRGFIGFVLVSSTVPFILLHFIHSEKVTFKRYFYGGNVDKASLPCDLVQSDSDSSRGDMLTNVTCNAIGQTATNVSFRYINFKIHSPLFITEKSRNLFYLNEANRKFIGPRNDDELQGQVYIVRNGTYDLAKDCGFRSQVSDIIIGRNISRAHWYHRVAPIFTPEACTFQHFIDSALPKLIQSLHILQTYNVTLLFEYRPRDKIIYEILEKLRLTNIDFEDKVIIGADYMYFTCVTPPLHPFLWQEARGLIGVPGTLTIPVEEAHVVFVTRVGCFNCGRKILNAIVVIKKLRQRYGTGVVKVFKGNLKLNETIEMFGKARIIMGSHGGGMYNINFAPDSTAVIEFMPTNPDGTMEAASKTIIWSQADMLRQMFWRMCIEPIPYTNGNMNVPLDELENLLDEIDKRQNTESRTI